MSGIDERHQGAVPRAARAQAAPGARARDLRRVGALALLPLLPLAAWPAPPPPPPAAPCDGEAFHRFDFWLGRWEVRSADGRLAGFNEVSAVEGDCVLLEQWRGATGGTGMSMNVYDPVSAQWRQLWHSTYGVLIDIRGGWDGSAMVLSGTITYVARTERRAFRGTWTPLPDGRVRQFFEESADGGATWSAWFEGFYSRARTTPGPLPDS